MGTSVDPAYIERLQEDIIIACHRLEETGHESLVITVSEDGHLIFGSEKGKRFLEDRHVFIMDFILHCQNNETVVKVESEFSEGGEITENKEQVNKNKPQNKSLSIDERDLTNEVTGKDKTENEIVKDDISNVSANVETAAVETSLFDDDTDEYDETENFTPLVPKLETEPDNAAVDQIIGEVSMNSDEDKDDVAIKVEQSEHDTKEKPRHSLRQMSDAKVVLKRIKAIINSNQNTHLRTKMSKLKAPKSGQKAKGKDTPACDICGKELSTWAGVKRHKICYHTEEKDHVCEECGKKFKLLEGLQRHKSVHSTAAEHKCEICDKAFKTASYVKKHMDTHAPSKPFTCKDCGKGFLKQESLDLHERIHSGEKAFECKARMFQCEKCCKSYDRQSSLVKHSHVHNELKPFVCSICQKAFVYKDSLNQHKLTHTDVATAVCPICGKTFKQRASLSKHKSIHEPAKYTCDSCGRKFYRKEFLLAHLKTHGDKKQCSACKARVFHLDKHICKMERREPQHQCPVCEKRFQQKRYLTEHIKSTHTKTRLFVCIKCNKTFNYRASLHNHNKYCMLQNQNHAIETNAPSTENEFTTEDIAQSDTHAPATV